MTCPPKNEHRLDRLIRIVVGATLVTLTFVGPHLAWGLVGLVPLVTGISGRCPLYMALGVGTIGIGVKRPDLPRLDRLP
jgi:hypothetical protein